MTMFAFGISSAARAPTNKRQVGSASRGEQNVTSGSPSIVTLSITITPLEDAASPVDDEERMQAMAAALAHLGR